MGRLDTTSGKFEGGPAGSAQPIAGSGWPRMRTVPPSKCIGRSPLSADRCRQAMAIAGHDLKQPLQVMIYAIERLARHVGDRDDDRQWVTAAMGQASRLCDGLSQLVAASKEGVGDEGLANSECFSTASLLDELEGDCAAVAQMRGTRLRVVRCSALIISNRKQLKAILSNLLDNAIKYAPGGRVVLGCRRRCQKMVIEIIDDGCGISTEDQERIFEPFHQVDAGTEGHGLGLSFVRAQCDDLSHPLHYCSVPGRGSRFGVEVCALPAQ